MSLLQLYLGIAADGVHCTIHCTHRHNPQLTNLGLALALQPALHTYRSFNYWCRHNPERRLSTGSADISNDRNHLHPIKRNDHTQNNI